MTLTEQVLTEQVRDSDVSSAAFDKSDGARLSPLSVGAVDCPPGRVRLSPLRLKQLRRTLLLSQQELALECSRRRLRLSIASIKRAETGQPVLFRTARELACLYAVPIERLCS